MRASTHMPSKIEGEKLHGLKKGMWSALKVVEKKNRDGGSDTRLMHANNEESQSAI